MPKEYTLEELQKMGAKPVEYTLEELQAMQVKAEQEKLRRTPEKLSESFGAGLAVGIESAGENLIKAPIRLLPEKQEQKVLGFLGLEKGRSVGQTLMLGASTAGQTVGSMATDLALTFMPFPGNTAVIKFIGKVPGAYRFLAEAVKGAVEYGTKGYLISGGEKEATKIGTIAGAISPVVSKVASSISKIAKPKQFIPKTPKAISKPITDIRAVKLPTSYGNETAEQLASRYGVYDNNLGKVIDNAQRMLEKKDTNLVKIISQETKKPDWSGYLNALKERAKIFRGIKGGKGGDIYSKKAFELEAMGEKSVSDLVGMKKYYDIIANSQTATAEEKEAFAFMANQLRLMIRKQFPEIGKAEKITSDLITLKNASSKVFQSQGEKVASYQERIATALLNAEKANSEAIERLGVETLKTGEMILPGSEIKNPWELLLIAKRLNNSIYKFTQNNPQYGKVIKDYLIPYIGIETGKYSQE
jgi:hypothetical protein